MCFDFQMYFQPQISLSILEIMDFNCITILISDPRVSASLFPSSKACAGDSDNCTPASKAIDGIYIPEMRIGDNYDSESIAQTSYFSKSPYLQIDLGKSRCVKGVKIWNRSNVPVLCKL